MCVTSGVGRYCLTDASESLSAGISIGGRGEVYPRQAEARITLQKLPRTDGYLSARTLAFIALLFPPTVEIYRRRSGLLIAGQVSTVNSASREWHLE
jgi:hypothetical protein